VRIHIDDDELRTLELDISKAPGRIQRNGTAATRKSARLVEKGMKVDASGHRYLPKLADAVSHELDSPLSATIGLKPEGSKNQGSLAHIIVYGSVNNAPVYDHTKAIRRLREQIIGIYGDAAEDSVLGQEKK